MGLEGREIAVIGAGIGGLSAGLALARRGASVRVFEAAPELAEVGAGLQLGPNAVAVLDALGSGPAVSAVASLPQAIDLVAHDTGRSVAHLPLGAAAVARYGRPYWQIHRADLVAVLAAEARAAGVGLRFGARLREAAQGEGHVTLAFEDGTTAHAEVLIGADGVRSSLRAAHFGGQPARFTGQVAWRALVPADRVPAGLFPPGACVTMGPGRHLVTYPLRGGQVWNLVAVEERNLWTEEGWSLADDPAHLRRAFAGWHAPVGQLLEAVDSCFLWGLFDHPPLPGWARGQIALLGDACHPMLPFLAQGAAMAIEDAWVLADCLARAPRLARGLAAYSDRRLARATRVQRAAARNARLYHLADPRLRALAHTALRTANHLAPGALLGRFDWLYGADVTRP